MEPRQFVADGAHFIRLSGRSPIIYGGLSDEALRNTASGSDADQTQGTTASGMNMAAYVI